MKRDTEVLQLVYLIDYIIQVLLFINWEWNSAVNWVNTISVTARVLCGGQIKPWIVFIICIISSQEKALIFQMLPKNDLVASFKLEKLLR